jgi:hypothetical protein
MKNIILIMIICFATITLVFPISNFAVSNSVTGFEIRLINSNGTPTNYCLDMVGWSAQNNTKIQIWNCDNSWTQKWGRVGFPYKIKMFNNNGYCLDFNKPVNVQPVNGTPAIIYNCNSVNTFSIQPRQIQDKSQKFCLDVSNGNLYNGAPVQMWTCNNTAAQNFVYDFQ